MEESELRQTLQKLEEQQQKILSELAKSSQSKRDPWDKLAAISPILSGLFIALSALLCTYQYNQQQIKLQEAQTVERFIPHLMGNETSKRMAILAMKTLVNTDLAAKYAAMFPSAGTISALKTIEKTGDSKDKKIVQQVLGKTSNQLSSGSDGNQDDASPLILEDEDQQFSDTSLPAPPPPHPATHPAAHSPALAVPPPAAEGTGVETKIDATTGSDKTHKQHPVTTDEKDAADTQSKHEELKPSSGERSRTSASQSNAYEL